jgi:uncharacterized protein YdaU (DUF1376 family)
MSLPYLPLFPDAYFGDTKHLTCEQHGAYLQLLMIAWRSGGTIPDDDAKLARMTSLSRKRWAAIKETILQFWVKGQDGGWSQKRLVEELREANARIETRRAAGRLGGRPKSLKTNNVSKSNGSAEEKQNESKTKAPISIPIEEEDTNVSSTRARKTDFDVWYQSYPHKVGRAAAEKSYYRCRKSGASQQELVLGLERYVKTKPPDREWCNPATWLNQERWKDQPASLKGSALDVNPALEHGSEVAGQVFVQQDTPQWDAWTRYRGRPPPTDRRGGWLLPSEWPPELELSGCNQSEKPDEGLRH